MLVTASKELKFIEWPDTSLQNTFETNNSNEICSLSWCQDNNFVIYVQKNEFPQILSLKNGPGVQPVHTITAIDQATVAGFQNRTKRIVAIGTALGTVALYDTRSKAIVKLINVPDCVVTLDFNVNDRYLGIACSKRKITVSRVSNGNEVASFSIQDGPTALHFHPSRETLLGVSGDAGNIYLFNIVKSETIFTKKAGRFKLNNFAFSPKNDTLITVGEDCKFCVYDYVSNGCVFRGCLQYPLASIDFSSDGKYFIIGSDNGCICIYESKDYKAAIHVEKVHSARVTFVKFSNATHADLIRSCDSVSTIADVPRPTTRDDSEFMALYEKYINKDGGEDAEVLKKLKEDVVNDFSKTTLQFHQQIFLQLVNLQEYIATEFQKINHDLDYKFHLLDSISGKHGDLSSNEIFESEGPFVIE